MSPTPITQPCAVALEAEAVKALAADLTKAVRRLHRVMKACEQCPNADDCYEICVGFAHIIYFIFSGLAA
jgi:hypothetical protein